MIGLFDGEELRSCQQAVGGGPVILWKGKIANPAVGAETDEFLPFNPLGEDFVQLDWRMTVYSGAYPKTAVCVGDLPGGHSFLVLANSAGITGVELARALRNMGCHDALGGDDDTSTQAVWRGQASGPARSAPSPTPSPSICGGERGAHSAPCTNCATRVSTAPGRGNVAYGSPAMPPS